MVPKPDIEDIKRLIASALYERGFGEDPLRNWYMGCLLIEHPEFKNLCARAYNIQFYGSSSSSMKQAMMDLLRSIAQAVHEASLGLALPSHDPDTNWRAAEGLLGPLQRAAYLYDDIPKRPK